MNEKYAKRPSFIIFCLNITRRQERIDKRWLSDYTSYMKESLKLAQIQNRGQFGNDPNEILEKVKNRADPYHMIETRLDDDLNTASQAFGSTNRIANTLDQVRNNLDPFVQWMVFIWLSFAVILIVWNALKLSTSWVLGDDTQAKEIKTKIYNIVKWVVVITAAFFIIRLLLSAISYVLK